MKKRLYKTIKTIPIVLPILFVLIFLGYAPVKLTAVLHVDDVVGDGIGTAFLCPANDIAYEYRYSFYLGSQTDQVVIHGIHYDVESLTMQFPDASEINLRGLDVYMFGIPLTHHSLDRTESLELEGLRIDPCDDGHGTHLTFPESGEEINFGLKLNLLPANFWLIYWCVFSLVVLLCAFGLSFLLDHLLGAYYPLLKIAAIAAVMICGCFVCGSLPYVEYTQFLMNWIMLIAAALVIDAVTLPFFGTVLTLILTIFWYIANYFLILFRNKPVMPADLKAIGTAKEVAGAYNLTPNGPMLLGIALTAFYTVLLIILWNRHYKETIPVKKQLLRREISVVAATLLIVVSINNPIFRSLSNSLWDNAILCSFHRDGMVVTFVKQILESRITKPDGYQKSIVESYLNEYKEADAKGTQSRIQPVNIIMVMNEAFSDLRVAGLNPAVDVMPYIDSLDDNTIEGGLRVSVYGGGTCNTEFEALTGNSMAFLPAGSYPYTSYIDRPMFSLAEYFRNLGYSTDAFHANDAENWNRKYVYPRLGFEKFHDIQSFERFGELEVLHSFPSDINDYRYMEALSEEKAGTKRFLFDVTMQNHGPYDHWLDVKQAESVVENAAEYFFDTQVYLSLVKVSDDGVRQLVETYRDSDEPTMIVFFGDHQPGLPAVAQGELFLAGNKLDAYVSKFFIWTNYETESQHEVYVSANYLPWLILEQGGFDLPPYVQMLKEVHEKYPIISSQCVIDVMGNVYSSISDISDDPLIQKYRYVQYANMFDEIDEAWFEVS